MCGLCFVLFGGQAEWSAGSELQWTLIGYLEEVFSALLLGLRPPHLSSSTPAGLSHQPREVLEQDAFVPNAEVDSLVQQLVEAQVGGYV